MKILFTVWLLIGGNWVHGSQVDGWSPLLTATEEECLSKLEFTSRNPSESIKYTCEVYDG